MSKSQETGESRTAIHPTVLKLGLVSMFADIASEMLYPITPIFLTATLGASMASVGAIEGTAEAIASLLKTYSGAWSDRIRRRRPFVATGYLLAAIAKPLIGVSSSWFGVLLARGLDRTGKGIRTAPRDALLADAVDQAHRGRAFGWHRAMDTAGAAIGPLLALLYLRSANGNLRPIFLWALIPGLLSVALVFTVREKRETTAPQKKKTPLLNPFAAWRGLDREFKRYLLAWGLFSIGNSSDVFLLLKAKENGLGTQGMILAYCAYNLVYAFSSPWLGGLSDRLDRRRLLCAGLVVFALVYAGFAAAVSVWQFWLLFLAYGLYMGATDGVGKALAVDLSPPAEKATRLGLLGTVTGLAAIVASAAAGSLWDAVGPTAAFLYGAATAVIGAVVLLRK